MDTIIKLTLMAATLPYCIYGSGFDTQHTCTMYKLIFIDHNHNLNFKLLLLYHYTTCAGA